PFRAASLDAAPRLSKDRGIESSEGILVVGQYPRTGAGVHQQMPRWLVTLGHPGDKVAGSLHGHGRVSVSCFAEEDTESSWMSTGESGVRVQPPHEQSGQAQALSP